MNDRKMFRVPIYGIKVYVHICDPSNEVLNGSIGICDAFRNEVHLYYSNKHLYPGNIAHEISHAVDYIFLHIGDKPDYDNDEPYAYLTAFITDKVYEYREIREALKKIL